MFLDKLKDDELWFSYYQSKIEQDFISDKEKKELEDFVLNKKYQSIVNLLYHHKYHFSIPQKHYINKNHGSKKRIVYTYTKEEMQVLKFIAYLLYEYDYLFSKNLYSFRKVIGVRDAVKSITYTKNIQNMVGYKVDIKNYFNSISKDILLKNLQKDILDQDLYSIISDVIGNDYVFFQDSIIKEQKGVIAGNPISAFLANYYLREIDEYFWKEKVFYIRYADDILIFSNSEEEREKYRKKLYSFLQKYHLDINPKKEHYYEKGEKFEFLGFSFSGKEVDISHNTLYKIKGKIRRSMRGYRRWMLKNGVDSFVTIKAINRKYQKKFFGNDNSELSWRYWYFPTITTSKSLKLIDQYFQEEVRYMITGKHNKKNYQLVPYSVLKDCHYRSLVHEFYLYKNITHNK